MTTLIILLIIYLISVYMVYKWIQKAHYDPNGKWLYCKPNNEDLFFTFCPFLNTIVMIINFFDSPIKRKIKVKKEITFFKPKNYKQ